MPRLSRNSNRSSVLEAHWAASLDKLPMRGQHTQLCASLRLPHDPRHLDREFFKLWTLSRSAYSELVATLPSLLLLSEAAGPPCLSQ